MALSFKSLSLSPSPVPTQAWLCVSVQQGAGHPLGHQQRRLHQRVWHVRRPSSPIGAHHSQHSGTVCWGLCAGVGHRQWQPAAHHHSGARMSSVCCVYLVLSACTSCCLCVLHVVCVYLQDGMCHDLTVLSSQHIALSLEVRFTLQRQKLFPQSLPPPPPPPIFVSLPPSLLTSIFTLPQSLLTSIFFSSLNLHLPLPSPLLRCMTLRVASLTPRSPWRRRGACRGSLWSDTCRLWTVPVWCAAVARTSTSSPATSSSRQTEPPPPRDVEISLLSTNQTLASTLSSSVSCLKTVFFHTTEQYLFFACFLFSSTIHKYEKKK